MRILAIRGQNLASLSERFEIDLTADPLSGTGLFAITGDTGAGKSTILDAMCLALYGNYPRASIEKREKVADPSGELIEVSDSRNILTRGAAQGFAEIDFIGQDGVGYRARWQVRRARNKAAGNLQKADYVLERLDGSGAIATSKRDVLSAVEERSGFTFDEFRRSVLLAQGEFDAFLLADEGKRADLLEKSTGTEIYSRISMRVFEDTAERERALEALMQQQTAIGVMPEEEREALLAEQQQKIAERTTQADACEQLGQVLKCADDIAKAHSDVAVAQSALQEADAAWEAVSAEREHFQRLCIVAPLRVKAEAVSGCEGEQTNAASVAAQRQQQLSAAEGTCADSVKAFAECESRARAAEAEVLRWEPEWRLADGLDQQVALARVEREKADKVVAVGATLAEKRRVEAEQSRERYCSTQALHAKTLEALEGRKPHARLTDEATSIAQLFANRAGLVARIAGDRNALTAVERDEVALIKRGDASRTAVAARNAERRKLAGQLTERRAALDAIDLDTLEIRDEVLRAIEEKLGKCRDAVQRRDAARVAETRGRAEAATAAHQRDEAASKLKIAEQVHTRKTDERAETARMADLAEATLSEHAASLRTHLVEGAPCPVCGADEHPFVVENSAAAKLARAVRQRRTEIDAALTAAEADIFAANAAVMKATGASETAEKATAAEVAKAAEAVATLSALLPEVASEFAGLGLASALNANPEAVGFAALGSATTEVTEARKAIAVPRDRGRVLRRECNELQPRLDALVNAIETETAEAQKEAAELSKLQAERSRLAATVQAHEEQLAQGLAALEPVLARADLTPADVERDPAAAERRVRMLADEYAKLISVRDDLSEELRRLDLEQKGCEERYQAASHEHGNAVRGSAERARQLESLVQHITKENYRLVLGLEIHLHLKTEKKMFCRCSADIWEKEPNSVTCPVCLGLPGALPVPNEEAVKKTQLLGLSLGCVLNQDSRFDRKHYFYPDLPKGYQISQYKQPLCLGGSVELDSGFVAEIERIHLEEDVAKSFHEKNRTLLDFNKSGMPLVEIVTRPVFLDVRDAVDFCKKIQQMVRFLNLGDVDMEKGQMRLEANISLRTVEMEKSGKLCDYKVEVKNINSFRFMEKAVLAEVERQLEIFEKEEFPVQENRGFSEATGKTVPQRTKEDAKDYRYFPEPDIPPMVFSNEYVEEIKQSIPELPYEIKMKLVENYGIKMSDAVTLLDNFGLDMVKKFENYVNSGLDAKKVAGALVNKKETHDMSEREFKDFIIGEKESLSKDALEELITKIIDENPKAVEDYKKGKENSLQYILGQVMRETKGSGDAVSILNLIKSCIK